MKYVIQIIFFIITFIIFDLISTLLIELYINRELKESDYNNSFIKSITLLEMVFSFALMRFLIIKQKLPYNRQPSSDKVRIVNPLEAVSASPSDRYLAIIFDSFILLFLFIFCAKVIVFLNIELLVIKALILSPVFLYDPLLVYFFGATIGHRSVGLKVVSSDGKQLTFLNCIIRFLLKTLLGGISLLTVLGERRQALHDRLTSTFVIYSRKSEKMNPS
ncbi:MAG: RDD family protein [Leptospira sp.]|nr:RDD family protein [Leptospira sp.]